MALLQAIHLSHLPPDRPIYVFLFQDVKNAAFLRSQLLSGNSDFEYAFIDASVIVSRTHILAAVFRAVNDMLNGRLKSRNVHSEIVFSLSPNNNSILLLLRIIGAFDILISFVPHKIAESFRRFGISDTTPSLLIVRIPTGPDITFESVQQHLCSVVEGTALEFLDESLSRLTDLAKVKKIYKFNSAAEGKNKRPSQGIRPAKAEAEDSATEKNTQALELEVAILGIMALRGVN
ncbi:MAG: hypothetical protein M1835_007598 [Candelina submexicana]|nr:MAG: hypothetical protein M1835_007598 [Candelina submexicana]